MHANTPSLPPLRAHALRKGSTLRLVSPSSWFDPAKVQAGMEALRAMELQPQLAQNALAHHGQYSAGTPQQRLQDLHAAFLDPTVDVVLCTRGGYGAAELLAGLDVKTIRKYPKVFIGCSDVTTLLTWLQDATGLITFHGPMAAGDFARENGVDLPSWRAALQQTAPWSLGAGEGLRILKPGYAHGKFYGGCLSMRAASLGTPYEIRTEDTILFLEDVSTRPYQIDRMLMQLRLAGKLRGVRGIVFGPMRDCGQPGQPEDFLDRVLLRTLEDFSGPVVIGLRSGHVAERNITLPIGVQCALDATQPDVPGLQFLEAAVVSE